MLLTDDFIYFELQKTASTYTRMVLQEMYPDTYIIIGKHNTVDKIPNGLDVNFKNKLKIGNIRNPWDWYVSLWSFGCKKRGGLRFRLMTKENSKSLSRKGVNQFLSIKLKMKYPKLDTKVWKQLYSDPSNFDNFNTWLNLILAFKEHNIGEDFKTKQLSQFSGLLTYRYLKLYTSKNNLGLLQSYEELENYDHENNFIDKILRKESLEGDLYKLIEQLNLSTEKLHQILSENPTRPNESEREEDYRKYYTDESASLISNYEKLIIEKYNYSFDSPEI